MTLAIESTSCWAAATSAVFSSTCLFSSHQLTASAPMPIARPTRSSHWPTSRPSSLPRTAAAGLDLRTVRLPSESRLILIIALVPHPADRQAHGDRHHGRDRLQPRPVEVDFLVLDAAQRVHQLRRHMERLPQDLLEVRREGAAAGKQQLRTP